MSFSIGKPLGWSEGYYHFLGQRDVQSFKLYINFYFQKTKYLSIKQKKISKNSNNFNALIDDRPQFVIRTLDLF